MKFVRGGKNGAVMRKTVKSVSREERLGESDVETEILDEALRRTLMDVRKRPVLFKFEAVVVKFMRSKKTEIKFPPIGSFHRMLLHHIADRFRMDHAVLGDRKQNDQRGVVLRKNARTEMPSRLLVNFDLKSSDASMPQNVSIVKKVKKRETKAKREKSEKADNTSRTSHEDRQKSYEEARARIFGSGGLEDDDEDEDEVVHRRNVSSSSSVPSVMYSVGPDMRSNGFGRGRGSSVGLDMRSNGFGRGRGSSAYGFGRGRGSAFRFGRGSSTFGGRGREGYMQHQQNPYGMMHHQNLMTQPQASWASYQQQRNYATRQVVDKETSRVPAPAPPRTESSTNTKKQSFVDSEFPPLS